MCLMIGTLFILQVIKEWHYKTDRPNFKVRNLIEKTASWVEDGFVSPDVWLDLKQYIRSDVLSDYIETTSVEKKPEIGASDCKTYLIFSGNN